MSFSNFSLGMAPDSLNLATAEATGGGRVPGSRPAFENMNMNMAREKYVRRERTEAHTSKFQLSLLWE